MPTWRAASEIAWRFPQPGLDEGKGAGLISAKEGNYLRHCHGSRAERVMQLTVPWSRLFYLTQVARAASERTSLQLDERLSPGFFG